MCGQANPGTPTPATAVSAARAPGPAVGGGQPGLTETA